MRLKENLLYSLLCSAAFTLFFYFGISKEISSKAVLAKYVGIFFVIMLAACFFISSIMIKRAERVLEEAEPEIEEEEEKEEKNTDK